MRNYQTVKSSMSETMKNIIKNQCQSILMSDISEKDKKEGLQMLICDDDSAKIVNEWLTFIIE